MGVVPDGRDACPAGPPAWLWPNLLSLDAPLVAVVWQRSLAAAFGVSVPVPASAVLGLVVWGVYLADRALDAADDTDRHRLARRHPRAFAGAAAAALLAALALAVARLPLAYLAAGAGVGAALAAYLGLVHFGRTGLKEMQVGAVFAAGVAVPLVASSVPPAGWLPAAAAFAGLCWLNCALIERWEGAADSSVGRASGQSGRRQAGSPSYGRPELPGALAAVAAAFAPRAVALAVGISLTALLALHLFRRRLSRRALRVLADVALLSPLACPL